VIWIKPRASPILIFLLEALFFSIKLDSVAIRTLTKLGCSGLFEGKISFQYFVQLEIKSLNLLASSPKLSVSLETIIFVFLNSG